ncbi:MAG: DUF3667 domain-containing protein [Gammaproteobacteria bacterium]|nr:DUF3667 domain-containing protein [Gammaproteobacteria bacterium]
MSNISTQSNSLQSQMENERSKSEEKCKNCETPLSGPFCHQCGQPNKSIIRFFGSLIHELLEDVISLDSRAARTLSALFFKPGFLTREYVQGRRFYYVPPLRLFLFTSIFCIFAIWVLNKTGDSPTIKVDGEAVISGENLDDSQKQKILKSLSEKPLEQLTEEERIKARKKLDTINDAMAFAAPENKIETPKELLTEQEKTKLLNAQTNDSVPEPPVPPESQGDRSVEEEEINSADAKQVSDSKTSDNDDTGIKLSDGNVTANVPFLSDADNKQLSERLTENIKNLKDPKEREDFFGDLLELVPKLMLLLVPLFAVLMKVCYPFAKRYYIEHLINAFHGHAFLFLAILLAILFEVINDSLSVSSNWLVSIIGHIFGFLEVVIFFWIPVYFLISIRRVYQQNWFLTIFKWFTLSVMYLILFAIATAIVLILSILFN